MLKLLKPDFIHEDERGKLLQLLQSGVRQVNLVWTNKGSKRGDHYHKWNTEIFYVIQGHIILKISQDSVYEMYEFSTGDMFAIEPYSRHSFEFIEDTLLLVCYDKGVEMKDRGKDIYSE